jgi:hypothetical protein
MSKPRMPYRPGQLLTPEEKARLNLPPVTPESIAQHRTFAKEFVAGCQESLNKVLSGKVKKPV